jgi:uncharacterized membrane protein YwaF
MYYKYHKGASLFMTQPCHMSIIGYALLLSPLADRQSKFNQVVFNMLVNQSWGAILAIVQPDLRDTHQFLEKEFFWFEHYILLAIPAYAIWTKRYHIIPKQAAFTLASFLSLAVYHSLILASCSIFTGVNLNYLLSPPVGILMWFGPWYRVVMYTACLPITFLNRYVVWASVELGFRHLKRAIGTAPSPNIKASKDL